MGGWREEPALTSLAVVLYLDVFALAVFLLGRLAMRREGRRDPVAANVFWAVLAVAACAAVKPAARDFLGDLLEGRWDPRPTWLASGKASMTRAKLLAVYGRPEYVTWDGLGTPRTGPGDSSGAYRLTVASGLAGAGGSLEAAGRPFRYCYDVTDVDRAGKLPDGTALYRGRVGRMARVDARGAGFIEGGGTGVVFLVRYADIASPSVER